MNNVSPIIMLVLLATLRPTIPCSNIGLIEWRDASEKHNRLPRDYIVRYHVRLISGIYVNVTSIDFEQTSDSRNKYQHPYQSLHPAEYIISHKNSNISTSIVDIINIDIDQRQKCYIFVPANRDYRF